MKIILFSFFLLISSSTFGQNLDSLYNSVGSMRQDTFDSLMIEMKFEDDVDRAYKTFSKKELIEMSYPSAIYLGNMECRLDNLSDSLIEFYAKYDAFYSMNDSVKKYYVVGNTLLSEYSATPKIALEKYKLSFTYTYCTPCKYQIKYNYFFEKFYLEKYRREIKDDVSEIGKEAREEEIKLHSKNKN